MIFTLESSLNHDAALSEGISYDRRLKRYRDRTGDFVSRKKVIELQKSYLQRMTDAFVSLAPRIIASEIGVYKEAAELLKRIHVSNAIIKAGGIDRLSSSDLGTIGNVLKRQYYSGKDETTGKSYGLKHLFREVQSKPNFSEKMLSARLDMYALSGELSGNIIERNHSKSIGLTEARRSLGAAHKHCDDCIRYESLGWVGIDDLPLPKTACQCRTRCKCTIEYR